MAPLMLAAMAVAAGGCVAPGSRDTVAATTALVAGQTPTPLAWRRDSAADAAARSKVDAMLSAGLTLPEAVSVAFLLSPELQLAFEQVEISRADFVAAVTPPNPVAIIGTRKPGGDLAAYYPDRSVSIGVLQNIIALLNIPDRRALARHDLERAQLEAAQRITGHAVQVTQAWIDYSAALRVQELRKRGVAAAQAALDTLVVHAANGSISTLDVAVERNTFFAAQGSALRANVEVATARERLGGLLALSGWRDDWQVDAALPMLPAGGDPNPATLERSAMDARLDLRAAAKQVDARVRVLATQRRFRWLNQLEVGVFRDRAIGGSSFTGPNAVLELPLFDQRQAVLLNADSELRTALRKLEAAQLAARNEIRTHAAEVATARALLEQYDREVLPNQRQIVAGLGTAADPGEPERLRLRLSTLVAEEEQVTLLRDYWRARSALAAAAGQWSAQSGL
jgi:cobalt-zinc-cadmium efflux system outer membrane protein